MSKLHYVELMFSVVVVVEDGETVEDVVGRHTYSIMRDLDEPRVIYAHPINSVHDEMGDWDKHHIPYGGDDTKRIEEWLTEETQ
jgi:hypothetical protein